MLASLASDAVGATACTAAPSVATRGRRLDQEFGSNSLLAPSPIRQNVVIAEPVLRSAATLDKIRPCLHLTLLLLRAITMACRGHHDVVLENLALRHRYLLRDRDSIYDEQVRRRIASLGIYARSLSLTVPNAVNVR